MHTGEEVSEGSMRIRCPFALTRPVAKYSVIITGYKENKRNTYKLSKEFT